MILHPTNSTEKNPQRFDRILFDSRLGVLCRFYRHPLLKIDEKLLSDHCMIGISICFRDIGTLDSVEDVMSAFKGKEHLIPLQVILEIHRPYVFRSDDADDGLDPLSFYERYRDYDVYPFFHQVVEAESDCFIDEAECDCFRIMQSAYFSTDHDRL